MTKCLSSRGKMLQIANVHELLVFGVSGTRKLLKWENSSDAQLLKQKYVYTFSISTHSSSSVRGKHTVFLFHSLLLLLEELVVEHLIFRVHLCGLLENNSMQQKLKIKGKFFSRRLVMQSWRCVWTKISIMKNKRIVQWENSWKFTTLENREYRSHKRNMSLVNTWDLCTFIQHRTYAVKVMF